MKSKEVPYSIISELKLRLLNTKKLKNFEGNEIPVIVSLTSIPFRLNRLHLVVKSLLIQTNKPKKIILWLDSSLENKIPNNLKRLFSISFILTISRSATSNCCFDCLSSSDTRSHSCERESKKASTDSVS